MVVLTGTVPDKAKSALHRLVSPKSTLSGLLNCAGFSLCSEKPARVLDAAVQPRRWHVLNPMQRAALGAGAQYRLRSPPLRLLPTVVSACSSTRVPRARTIPISGEQTARTVPAL